MENTTPSDNDTQNTNCVKYTQENIESNYMNLPANNEITTSNMESLPDKDLTYEDANKQCTLNCETIERKPNGEHVLDYNLGIQGGVTVDLNKHGVINNYECAQSLHLSDVTPDIKKQEFNISSIPSIYSKNIKENQQTILSIIPSQFAMKSVIPNSTIQNNKEYEITYSQLIRKQKSNLINELTLKNTEGQVFGEFKKLIEKDNISNYQREEIEHQWKSNSMNESETGSVKENTTEEINEIETIKDNTEDEDKIDLKLQELEEVNKKRKTIKQDPNKEYMEYECTLLPNKQQNVEINKIKAPPKQEDYDLNCDLFDNTNIQEENKLVKAEIEFDQFYVYAKTKNIKNPQYLPGKYKLYFEIFDTNKNEKKNVSNRKKCKFIINEIMLMCPKKDEFFKFLNDIDLISLEEIEMYYKEEIFTCLIHLCYFIYFYKLYLTRSNLIPVEDQIGFINTSIYSHSKQNIINSTNQEELKKQQGNIYESIKEIDFDFGTASYESLFSNFNLKDCDITKYPNLLRLLNKLITLAKEKSILKSCLASVKTAKYKTEKGLRGIVASNVLATVIPGGDYRKLRILIYKFDDEFNESGFNEQNFKEEIFNNFC